MSDGNGKVPDPERERLERERSEAQAADAAYLRAFELVRPYMEGTDRTLAEAIELMRADGIDVEDVTLALIGSQRAGQA